VIFSGNVMPAASLPGLQEPSGVHTITALISQCSVGIGAGVVVVAPVEVGSSALASEAASEKTASASNL
jgi:hypothetical protein